MNGVSELIQKHQSVQLRNIRSSRHLLHNTVPVVSSSVLCTLEVG